VNCQLITFFFPRTTYRVVIVRYITSIEEFGATEFPDILRVDLRNETITFVRQTLFTIYSSVYSTNSFHTVLFFGAVMIAMLLRFLLLFNRSVDMQLIEDET